MRVYPRGEEGREARGDDDDGDRHRRGGGRDWTAPVASIAPFPKNKVNAGEPARIKGTVTSVADASTLKMKWSATRAFVDPQGADQSVDLAADGFTSSVSLTTENLVLSPDVLETGYLYKFRLDVEDGNGAAAAFIELEENTPPSDGTLLSVPDSGTALTDTFTVARRVGRHRGACYRFVYRVKGTEKWAQLRTSARGGVPVSLPGGDEENGRLSSPSRSGTRSTPCPRPR